MKLLVLTMLLAVVQAAPPVPRQAANTGTPGTQSIAEQSGTQKQPSESPAIKNPQAPDPSQEKRSYVSTDNAQHAVRVVELPAVSVQRDRIDWLTLIFSGSLILIGGLGVYAAYRTLRAIETQATYMKQQSDLMVAKERARLEITFPDELDTMIVGADRPIYMGSFRLIFKNIGGTVAQNVVAQYDAFGSESEMAPQSENLFGLGAPDFIEGHSHERTNELTVNRRFSNDIVPEVFYVYLRVRIEYNDIFKPEKNTTRALLRRQFMRVTSGGGVSRVFWEQVGEPKDNKST